MGTFNFSKDFLWGCATASYQVEGACEEDGRKPCIWDTFSKKAGNVFAGENGSVACDQYHKYKEDIALMKELGFKSYRFSIAWPRIIPDGEGDINSKGIDYYRSLCIELRKANIIPMATLYHWDLPQSLQDNGEWINRETAYAFQKFAEVCFSELGDLVDYWVTINEPLCVGHISYFYGDHAPGMKDFSVLPSVIHHINLAHGLAVASYRKLKYEKPIGIVWNAYTPRPATDSEENKKAALLYRAFETDVYLLPVLKKEYPKMVKDELNMDFPILNDDLEIISQKIDFVGINYYNEPAVIWDETSQTKVRKAPNWQETTDTNWPIVPAGFKRLLRYVHSLSPDLPIYITENGVAFNDKLEIDGRVHDKNRISFLQKHIKVIEESILEGIPVRGYFVWSLLDNYEWELGYSKRFGIIYCDYKTLKRYPKDSAYFMRDVMAGYGEY